MVLIAGALFKRRQAEQRQGAGGQLEKCLLEDDSSDTELLKLRDEAEFCVITGAPSNSAAQQLCVRQWLAGESSSVREIPFASVHAATDGFIENRRLAGGGSCTVFKGDLYGLPVAVKQLHSDADAWNNAQYATEMKLLCEISRHDNICCLYAFSADGPQRCLVLELCNGGSLETRLACTAVGERPPPPSLQWRQRVQIAVGIAMALDFLHSLRPQTLHRDLKVRFA